MPRIQLLEKVAPEEGAYTAKFTFKDEEGNLVTPATINWWLSDLSGSIINGRSEVAGTPANPWYLTLQGDDLQMHNDKNSHDRRLITIKGTYNSDRGNNLPIVHSVMFKVRNLLIIAKDVNVNMVETTFTGESVNVI